MYGSKEELDILAAKAKEQLKAQQNKSDEEVVNNYEDIFDDEEEVVPNNVSQQNINKREEEFQQPDYDAIQRRLEADAPIIDQFDDVLFVGGPTKSQIQQWKKEYDGYDIYVTEILNETFIFRTLNRFEYKQLVSFIDINALQREEAICDTVTLWPIGYSYKEMATTKAGIPSTYSEIIMEKSGFTKDFAIKEI